MFPVEVPARSVAEVRKQGVNAGSCFWIAEIIFVLTVLERDRVKPPEFHDFEWITGFLLGQSVAHRTIVGNVDGRQKQDRDGQYSPQDRVQAFRPSISALALPASCAGSPGRLRAARSVRSSFSGSLLLFGLNRGTSLELRDVLQVEEARGSRLATDDLSNSPACSGLADTRPS